VKDLIARLATIALKWVAPNMLAYLLARLDSRQIAQAVKPHVLSVINKADPEWRTHYILIMKKLVEVLQQIIKEVQ